ncbi:hypothetical protein D1BOALGB6SA_7322 [Olavius sp. associated proteobacterium Delta 1]|nr:hypothetical protein D1BOALGB6SA_7322 [Olavius sp. associated proteobacterium Delta 1]
MAFGPNGFRCQVSGVRRKVSLRSCLLNHKNRSNAFHRTAG